jgi:hypothetical protein
VFALASLGEERPRGGLVAAREGRLGGNWYEVSETPGEWVKGPVEGGAEAAVDFGVRGEAGRPVARDWGCEAGDFGVEAEVSVLRLTGGATDGICTRRACPIEVLPEEERVVERLKSSADDALAAPSEGSSPLALGCPPAPARWGAAALGVLDCVCLREERRAGDSSMPVGHEGDEDGSTRCKRGEEGQSSIRTRGTRANRLAVAYVVPFRGVLLAVGVPGDRRGERGRTGSQLGGQSGSNLSQQRAQSCFSRSSLFALVIVRDCVYSC